MHKSTFVGLSPAEHRQMLAARRRARYGYLLALHILLWCAAGHAPTDIAVVLFCARSSVYRTVRAYRQGPLGWAHDAYGRLLPPLRPTVLLPTLRRSLVALRTVTPRGHGWCRTRWSCATLAMTLQSTRGIASSAETMRRWRHEIGWVWKRPKLGAKDDDPQRVNRLARLRWVFEHLKQREALVFADAWAIHLVPKGGCAWMPKGNQVAVMTPGQHQKHYLAGALDPATGALHHCVGPRKTNALFRDLLGLLEGHDLAERYARGYVVVDNDKIPKAKAVEEGLAAHPRVPLLFLPTYCPQANPIERAFGDGHALCTRHHTRRRLRDLVADVEEHRHVNGPWLYKLADIDDEPAVTEAVENMAAAERSQPAA